MVSCYYCLVIIQLNLILSIVFFGNISCGQKLSGHVFDNMCCLLWSSFGSRKATVVSCNDLCYCPVQLLRNYSPHWTACFGPLFLACNPLDIRLIIIAKTSKQAPKCSSVQRFVCDESQFLLLLVFIKLPIGYYLLMALMCGRDYLAQSEPSMELFP